MLQEQDGKGKERSEREERQKMVQSSIHPSPDLSVFHLSNCIYLDVYRVIFLFVNIYHLSKTSRFAHRDLKMDEHEHEAFGLLFEDFIRDDVNWVVCEMRFYSTPGGIGYTNERFIT
ncbi:unnamed protein product [Orchesella dallaii]|uniref:Uncharacterized protein n=1 Tax=Orchesella dallaii TaxID=48710 RepID=A0ABP1PKS7_9HEXA